MAKRTRVTTRRTSAESQADSPIRIVSVSLTGLLTVRMKAIARIGNASVSGLVEQALTAYVGQRSNAEVARRLKREGVRKRRNAQTMG